MFSRECLINIRLQCHPDAQFDGTSAIAVILSLCISVYKCLFLLVLSNLGPVEMVENSTDCFVTRL